MKETLTKPKKKDGLFGGLNLNVFDILKSNRDNAENEEAISNGGEISKKGSELIARFHSIYEHIFYQGYENYDKINKVAKFFEAGNYAKAIRVANC